MKIEERCELCRNYHRLKHNFTRGEGKERGMKATWVMDYDMFQDKCYDRPGCPECETPIGLFDDGKYHCYSCGEEVEVIEPDMIAWLEERSKTKIEYTDCMCGGKGTVETHYMKNPITLEWQTIGGSCSQCGMRFIV